MYHLATVHSVTDGRMDSNIMPIANHTACDMIV